MHVKIPGNCVLLCYAMQTQVSESIHLVNHQNVMMDRNDAEHSGDSCYNKKAKRWHFYQYYMLQVVQWKQETMIYINYLQLKPATLPLMAKKVDKLAYLENKRCNLYDKL